MKNETSKIWDNKALMVLVSIISAILIWVYVTTTEGDVRDKTFEGVQVVLNGAEGLRDRENFVISDLSANSVTVTLRGTLRTLSKLTANNITAVVDVSKITSKGNNTMPFTMEYPSGIDKSSIDLVSSLPETVSFYVDKASSKSIELKGEFTGSVVEGFAAGTISFEPREVTISGPEKEINRVAYALVQIPRENVDKTLKFDSEYTLVDAEGKEIELGNIRLETQTVSVTLPITATKEVPLSVDIIDGGGATMENVKLKFEPETITIAGDAATLEGINKISLGTIDLASFVSTLEEKFPIVLDNEVSNVTGLTEAKVTVEVLGLKTAIFNVSNISIINTPAGRTSSPVTEMVEVMLRGNQDVIDKVKANNIRAVIDLAEIGSNPGVFHVNAKIYVDGYTGVGAVCVDEDDYKLYVKIT